MAGAVVLTLLLLVATRQDVSAATTTTPNTSSPDRLSTKAPATGPPDTTITKAPGTGSPDTTITKAPATGPTDTTITKAPATGSPDTTITKAPATGSPDTTITKAPATGPTDTTITKAPATGSPDTTITKAPATGSPDTTITKAPATGSPDTTMTEPPDTGSPQTVQTNDPNVTRTQTNPVTTMAGGLTTAKPGNCTPGACVNGSTCIQLYQRYECRCPLNYYYSPEETCSGGESFYGEFTISGQNFNPNPESPEYTKIYTDVMSQCKKVLSDLHLRATIVLEMRAVSSKSQARSDRTGSVIAKVINVFAKGAVTADKVHKALETPSEAFTYTRSSICDGFFCDAETTNCEATPDDQGASCTCMDGKFSSSAVPEVTSCRDCDPKCYETEWAYCKLAAKTGASCVCIPGYKESGGKCQKCDFGYSGENCTDNFLLILVVVGVVLGASVFALVGAVISVTVSSKKGKKHSDQATLIEKEEAPFSEGSPAPARLFPKVQAKTNLGEVNKGANVFEDYEEYSRNFPKRDYEENPWYEMAKTDRNY
ncbi:mucin-13 [Dendrobates tinctorius]|uniref:mucin-13 n=1 Tax=Dendrobates tinctorius TaxID=92724 RepID=UPI003CC93CD9